MPLAGAANVRWRPSHGSPLSFSPGRAALLLSGGTPSLAVVAASAGLTDVQNAVNAANTGQTVIIPPGNATWSGTLDVTKAIRLVGSGKSGAAGKITHNAGQYTPLININLASGDKANFVRVSDVYFENTVYCPSAGANQYTWDILIDNESTLFRIDNCTFHYGKEAVTFSEKGPHIGVIDNCYFDDVDLGVRVQDDAIGTGAWDRSISLGSGNTDCVTLEDNAWFYSNAGSSSAMNESIYHSNAGRSTIRNNSFVANDYISNFIDAHGRPGCDRGTVLVEAYNNTFTCTTVGNMCYLRGGTQVWHDNAVTTTGGSAVILLANELAWPAYGQDATWPSFDQLFNCFFWNNTVNGGAMGVSLNNPTYDAAFVQSGRDYFTAAPAASGGKSSFPTTAGNDDMTFSGSGANAYYPYSTATYPHPNRSL